MKKLALTAAVVCAVSAPGLLWALTATISANGGASVGAGGLIGTFNTGDFLTFNISMSDPGGIERFTLVITGDGVNPVPEVIGTDRTHPTSLTWRPSLRINQARSGRYPVTLTINRANGDITSVRFFIQIVAPKKGPLI